MDDAARARLVRRLLRGLGLAGLVGVAALRLVEREVAEQVRLRQRDRTVGIDDPADGEHIGSLDAALPDDVALKTGKLAQPSCATIASSKADVVKPRIIVCESRRMPWRITRRELRKVPTEIAMAIEAKASGKAASSPAPARPPPKT